MSDSIKNTARQLRLTQTSAEKLLWDAVRNRKVNGLKVRRQYPITFPYDGQKRCFVADFYCPVCKLIIEIDGGIHEEQQEYDQLRTDILEKLGYRVIRFDNDVVENDIDSVVQQLVRITTGLSADR